MPYAKRVSRYSGGVAAGRYLKKRELRNKYGGKASASAALIQAAVRRAVAKTSSAMMETKEGQYKSYPNTSLPQNQVYVVKTDLLQTTPLNPFKLVVGDGDPASYNSGSRIGDQINVKGLKIVAFIENALKRPKVFYRLMLVRCAKGDTIDRNSLFKNDSDNKMIDCVNTERFTIIAQRRINIYSQGTFTATSVNAYGEPQANNDGGGAVGSKIITMWVPGRKFGKYGKCQYEDQSTSQLKFFDYRVVIVAYDWYGTPQDANTVGKLNELYTKLYFKDA